MKQNLFLKLLVLVTCLSSALSATAYSFSATYNGKTIYYNITSSANRTVEVTYNNYGSTYSGAVTIPSTVTYNGYTYTVTAIGEEAFRQERDLTSITLPNTITRIGDWAFAGQEMDNYPPNITTITIPNSVTTIGENAFAYNYHLTSVTIPNSVTTIGESAFWRCHGLKTVSLGTGLTSISDYAFGDCALTSVTIPNNVETIGHGAFRDNLLTTVTIPNNVETIGDYAFYNCPITTLYLGFSVVSIGDYAFSASNSYVSNVYCYAYLPPTIQENTFVNEGGGPYGWHFRGTLHLLAASYNTNRYQSTDYWMRFLYFTTISGSTAYDVQIGGLYYMLAPTSLSNIALVTNNGNYNCYTSSSYTVPANVTWRGESFKVTGIGNSAFRNCTSVSTLDLRNATNLTYINDYACYGANVSTVYLSPALTEIGDYAFYNSSVSKLYTNNSTPPTIKSNTFSTRYSTCWVYVPYPRDIATYKAATYWSNFVNYFGAQPYDFVVNGIYYKITGTNTVEVTNKWGGYAALNYDSDYTYSGNVTIPNTVTWNSKTYNVTAIGEYAFFEARQVNLNNPGEAPTLRAQGDLKSVTIGNNVTTIKDNAFWACTGLTSVTLGTGVTSIGYEAFSYCTALTSITSRRTTPPTVQSSTFGSVYSIATVYVPSIAAVNNYKAANYWRNFYLILPYDGTELDYALNVSGGNIHFTSTGTYPWKAQGDGTRIYAQSSNAGVASTTSAMTASVSLSKASILTFDFKAWGEGTSYDKCIFLIDGVEQFSYGARDNDWETYSANIPAGSHTLTWTYSKDSSVNPTGDYFAVDNVKLTEITTQTGDVNGDGQVTIADVTALIDSLLSGLEVPTHVADVNGDGQVTIADVTALIDMLLGS